VLGAAPEAQAFSAAARVAGHRVVLVPTMGALHEGHLRLVDEAHRHGERVVVSVFVNPAQFDRPDDFDRYPRTFDDDLAGCAAAGAHAVYAPSAADMYPVGFDTWVAPGALAEPLEGEFRPGHFRGMATVVLKLFNAVRPDVAVFGEKDFQQLAIVRRMARDLDTGIEVVGVPTVREPDGLALSSRNRRLAPADRARAAVIPRALEAAAAAVAAGARSADDVEGAVRLLLASEPAVDPEYVSLRDPDTLAPLHRLDGEGVLLLAAWVGGVRLIDNRRLAATS